MNARTYSPGIHAVDIEDTAQTKEAQAAAEAQADRQKLAALLDGAIAAMPEDTDPAQRPAVAYVLAGQALAGGVRCGLLPVRDQAGALTACRAALFALPRCPTLAGFQGAAKGALRKVMTEGG